MISKNKKECIVLGTGGHSKIVTSILETYNQYKIIGLIDKNPENVGKYSGNYKVIGYQDELEDFIKKGLDIYFIAIGDNYKRKELFEYIKSYDCSVPALVHKNAKFEKDFIFNEGVQICTGVIITSEVVIGENSLINSGAIIDHESIIGKNCHISTGVNITGKVKVGDNSFIGAGSTILPYIKIGRDTIIGAGSVVVKDIPSKVVAYGVPANVKRTLNI